MNAEALTKEFGVRFDAGAAILQELKWRVAELPDNGLANCTAEEYIGMLDDALAEYWYRDTKAEVMMSVLKQLRELERQIMVALNTMGVDTDSLTNSL